MLYLAGKTLIPYMNGSLVPRLSPHANEKSTASDGKLGGGGPGNEAI